MRGSIYCCFVLHGVAKHRTEKYLSVLNRFFHLSNSGEEEEDILKPENTFFNGNDAIDIIYSTVTLFARYFLAYPHPDLLLQQSNKPIIATQ
jgi:hypothetical protein